jgi:hypothetical protein
VTSHNPIARAPLFSEVVTGEEGRAMTLNSVPSEARPADSHHPRPSGTCCPTRHAGREVHNLPVGSAARRGARPRFFSAWPPTDEWPSLHRALRSGSVGALDHILEELEARGPATTRRRLMPSLNMAKLRLAALTPDIEFTLYRDA